MVSPQTVNQVVEISAFQPSPDFTQRDPGLLTPVCLYCLDSVSEGLTLPAVYLLQWEEIGAQFLSIYPAGLSTHL